MFAAPLSHYSDSCNQACSMFLKPLLSTLVIRYDPGYFIPEPIRMIHFLSMTKLMHHNIVQHFPRNQGQQAVEIQISLAAAATPPGMLGTYCNLIVRYSHEGRIVLNTLRNQVPSLLSQRFQLRFCVFLLTLRRTLCQVLLDPCGFTFNELPDFSHRHSLWTTDNHGAIWLNLNRNGLSVTSAYCIVHADHHFHYAQLLISQI